MMLIYTDSATLDNSWIPGLKFKEPIEVCHNIDYFVNHSAEKKIAFTTERMGPIYNSDGRKQSTGDYSGWHLEGFEDKINQLSEASQLVFSIEGEIHTSQLSPIWNKCTGKNIFWVLPGSVDDLRLRDNIITWCDWFKITTGVYKEIPQALDKLTHDYPKELYFDVLLGRPRNHRTFVYNAINRSNIKDKVIMTYYKDSVNHRKFFEEKFIWEQGCELIPNTSIDGTHSEVNYYGIVTGVSRIIPTGIYNKTAYSIIAETSGENAITFFTEKTAKPLIAKRLFVVFSGYRFLELLRSLGFRTFGDIIDESYDQIFDDTERFYAAFEQVKRLCEMDQVEVANKIKNTVEHNYNLIMNTDWLDYALVQVQAKIDKL